jgi:fructose-bisphosphate aldolase class II/tagatose 1,6-diphosphate aldolase GatY/KbaY
VKEQDSHLADPEQAREFCEQVRPDCFAPAIGTAHGIYKGEPKIAYHILERVAADTRVPIALHGGTGLADEVFRRCIALGCAKVNISTQIKYAFIDGFVGYHNAHNTQYDPLKVLKAQFDEMKKGIAANIQLFGSAGKA